MCVVPMTVLRGRNDLTVGVTVRGKMYRFMIDSGTEISLIQPYVWDMPVNHTLHMFRGITGDLLRAESACDFQFKLGSRCYTHSFVVAALPIERDGILGLDWMRSLRVKINFAHDQLEVAGCYAPALRKRDQIAESGFVMHPQKGCAPPELRHWDPSDESGFLTC
jgi:hypothetical protein